MKKLHLERVFHQLAQGIRRNSPEILTGLGIGGFITTTILAVAATPKAMKRIEERREREEKEKLSAKECIEETWTCYLPAAVTGVVSTVCVIGSACVSSKRNAALVTACTLSDNLLKEYRQQVAEVLDEEQQKALQERVDKAQIERNPPPEDVIRAPLVVRVGDTLCYDSTSGRYFYSDISTIRQARDKLNHQMTTSFEPYISLNDFYRELDNPNLTPIDIGDSLGWNANGEMIDVQFTTQLAFGSTPCLVMTHYNPPQYMPY